MQKQILFIAMMLVMGVSCGQQRDSKADFDMPCLTTTGLSDSSFRCVKPCDLLFFKDYGGMGEAISQSTGQYTHVAIVESVGDTVWMIDATPQNGVSRRPLILNHDDKSTIPDVYRLVGCMADNILELARSFIGQPYDQAFLPDNGAMYCSELVYECFIDSDGKHLFEAKPMNWRDADGHIPAYWVEHFEIIGTPIPEGVMGTNPTNLSHSKQLTRIR